MIGWYIIMNSETLKKLKKTVQSIVETNDRDFIESNTRIMTIEFLNELITCAKSASTYSIALIQYLTDNGYDVNILPLEDIQPFKSMYSSKLSKISPEQLVQIRKITKTFFS
jgi:transposase